MADVKLTKNELRVQQGILGQLRRYLPTLQLKKAMLQSEVQEARQEIVAREKAYAEVHQKVEAASSLLAEVTDIDFTKVAVPEEVRHSHENIAGVDVPELEEVVFPKLSYSLFSTPSWVDGVVAQLRSLTTQRLRVRAAEEKKAALERELREVSIRVNLFEKVLIPRAMRNIKKIKIFLGDQELAAVSQAKVAKGKIVARKLANQEEQPHAC